ncbi:hypothetical protein [Candidatus Albibeggiatoa sp. nov. BB20]|uniref:hypothetical protein n=1 Tax=Candidatus Albibeggiatoa sp. nov. BB20 TaxID=3162723 RepID=UPI0033655908
MEYDQIFFWDTSPDATVSMSESKNELKNKVISAHLIGGHIIVRPAELFEGDDFYFQDAISEDGYLYNLMKSGAASLALDIHSSLEERVNWRFRDGTVFDRGKRYTTKVDIEKIKKRTEERAEKITACGWKSCLFRSNRNKNQFEKDLNIHIKSLLTTVSIKYIKGGIKSNAAINSFINSSIQVVSRSDLYQVIENIWVLDITDTKKQSFITDCKSVLTWAAILNSTMSYGNRVSELKGFNYNTFSYFASASKLDASKVESTIMESFVKVLSKKVSTLESETEYFAKKMLKENAKEFANLTTSLVTPRDREELKQLLYGEFHHQSPKSLAQFVTEEWRKLKPSDIDRLVAIRFDELEKMYGYKTGRSKTILSTLQSLGIETILLAIGGGIPFLPTLISSFKELKEDEIEIRPIFSSYRKTV